MRLKLPAILAALAMASALPAAAGDIVAINPSSNYPEGPLWRPDGVYYAEMGSDRVMRWDGSANTVLWTRKGCGPTSVAQLSPDLLSVTCHIEQSIALITPKGDLVRIIDEDNNGRRFRTPNASISDGKGGVYLSSSGDFATWADAEGGVLHLSADGTLVRLAEGIHYSNGVALSPDGATLFVSEHLERRVLAYDVGKDGSLSGERVFVSLDDLEPPDPERTWEAGPDGLAIDREGNLFIAEYSAGHVLVVDAAGHLKATLEFPERFVTAIAIAADEKRIFVTAPAAMDPSVPGKVYSLANPLLP